LGRLLFGHDANKSWKGNQLDLIHTTIFSPTTMFDGEAFTPEEKTFFGREENRQMDQTGITVPELRSFWSCRPEQT